MATSDTLGASTEPIRPGLSPTASRAYLCECALSGAQHRSTWGRDGCSGVQARFGTGTRHLRPTTRCDEVDRARPARPKIQILELQGGRVSTLDTHARNQLQQGSKGLFIATVGTSTRVETVTPLEPDNPLHPPPVVNRDSWAIYFVLGPFPHLSDLVPLALVMKLWFRSNEPKTYSGKGGSAATLPN